MPVAGNLMKIRLISTLFPRLIVRNLSTKPVSEVKPTLEINRRVYRPDEWTNVNPRILSFLERRIHVQEHHPLSIVRQRIVKYFGQRYRNSRGNPVFSTHDSLSPIVSVEQNFDSLLIPGNHPSREKSQSYYLNRDFMLRAHTTVHQAELISAGLDNFLIVGDVYRRDEIDSTHYPVFHQLDAVRIHTQKSLFGEVDLEVMVENTAGQEESTHQPCHTLEAVKLAEKELKDTLVGLVKSLFGEKIKYRWVEETFPFTHPSWELEIFHRDKWMEILGCGIMRHEILKRCGHTNAIGFAFGLGLERLAMALFQIPDIRLFWSRDSGFLSQFHDDMPHGKVYKAVSVYPQCSNDLSFWLPGTSGGDSFDHNDFYDEVRSIGGDMVEQVLLRDQFKHPKSGRTSLCFRIIYRHMEKTLTQAEVNEIHAKIGQNAVEKFNVEIR
ncbi:probable phenylalanine--tRNA ligase, mitochondrial [Phlebotomus argentipes]|uniref:probable phenylalanine--tRNA ligase, mitochondrial n=1 Tax=Phlebotomus argentipes TaxID=94469 RepID=UPI002893477B|nr:probable phenylalanine--tRNA ligase, mitochondrial [Phlebotomus argentipes]